MATIGRRSVVAEPPGSTVSHRVLGRIAWRGLHFVSPIGSSARAVILISPAQHDVR